MVKRYAVGSYQLSMSTLVKKKKKYDDKTHKFDIYLLGFIIKELLVRRLVVGTDMQAKRCSTVIVVGREKASEDGL